MLTQHQWIDIATHTIVVCSILHSFLPPYDFLNDFPTAQRYYKLLIYIVGYVAINARSTVWAKQISLQKNGQEKPNA